MKANQFFFLTAVNSHINADVISFNDTTQIRFWDSEDFKQSSILIVSVKKIGLSYIVSYTMQNGGTQIQQGASDLIKFSDVSGVLAALANDAFL